MAGRFILASEIQHATLDWGQVGWISNPALTGAAQLAIVEGSVLPGKGHAFHKHPHQEEVLFVVSGQVEQWIDQEKRVLTSGDSAFIPAGVVHASFNVADGDAKLLAIFGPCVGDGFETIEVADEAPWNRLRAQR